MDRATGPFVASRLMECTVHYQERTTGRDHGDSRLGYRPRRALFRLPAPRFSDVPFGCGGNRHFRAGFLETDNSRKQGGIFQLAAGLSSMTRANFDPGSSRVQPGPAGASSPFRN